MMDHTKCIQLTNKEMPTSKFVYFKVYLKALEKKHDLSYYICAHNDNDTIYIWKRDKDGRK